MCVTMPIFVPIGQIVAEIWPFLIFFLFFGGLTFTCDRGLENISGLDLLFYLNNIQNQQNKNYTLVWANTPTK